MPIIAHGIDLVEVARIAALLARHGEHFADRCFSAAERAYCDAQAKRRAEHYAARFAAKEAVLKALGTGWRHGIAWTDIEVTRRPSGEPGLKLCGQAKRIADDRQVTRWTISLTHTDATAMASVIAQND